MQRHHIIEMDPMGLCCCAIYSMGILGECYLIWYMVLGLCPERHVPLIGQC